jgi:hypothetical protein
VREVLREPWNFGSIRIVERETNLGLAHSVIAGTTELANAYGRVIVLEDDLLTSPWFLEYMNRSLRLYADEPRVMQIAGYQFPMALPPGVPKFFFLPFISSWGWATWKRAWDHFDANATGWQQLRTDITLRDRFNIDASYPYAQMLESQMLGQSVDSWAIRWWWSVFRQNGIVLYSRTSLVSNKGFGELATHTHSGKRFEHAQLESEEPQALPTGFEVNEEAYKSIKAWLARVEAPVGRVRRLGGWAARWLRTT